ncbi:MAG: ActS/PrrB/RegB family redox-sensitive histidine kinase [Minwuia sp.]|nr:ActS/PrrB/RegB family redox-sensitive histidine kinase [Minwuia sp.]
MSDRQMAIQDLFVVGTNPGVSGSGRVRLQTLVLIRWIAVGGQSFSVLLIRFGLDFEFPFLPCLLAILASGVLNIVLAVQYPATARLSDRGAALFLAYDLLQLAALLYMTGGLTNPFVILVLVPVTISATILSVLSTAALGLLALVFTSLLAFWYLPLPWASAGLEFPALYVGAIWVALALGITFMATYAGRLAFETKRMSDALRATQLALSREQQLSAVGGIAAAAAHELGTPLGTIHLVARELQRDLATDSPLTEDIDLLVSQTERCRDILAELSRRPGDGDDTFRKTTIVGLVEAAVEPYGTGAVSIVIEPQTGHPPEVPRSPEVLHGLANLTENAVDFSRRQVRVQIYWDTPEITILLEDDGPGFPQDVLKTLGEPYTTTRRQRGGMGLGVFIATTLLGHTGATVDFSNRVEDGELRGARVAIRWPHGIIEQGTWG